jgi:flagellar FliL protein
MAKDEEKEATEEKKKGGKMKLVIIVLPLVLLIAAGGWYLFLRPKDDGGVKALPPPTPGAVVPLDPITINLAGGHFLKLGMALQPTAAVKEAPDGSKALDLAISQFSGKTIDDLSSSDGRAKAKAELVARIKLAYLPEGAEETSETTAPAKGGSTKTSTQTAEEKDDTLTGAQAIKKADALTVQTEVYDVYLTEFVMQ